MLDIREIEKGIHYYCCVDSKFKFNSLTINLIVALKEESAAKNAVLSSLLRQSSNKYRTNIELGAKLRSLYGADFFFDIKRAGNRQIVSFGIEILDDDFALENESLFKEATELLFEILFNPKIENGEFLEQDFEIERKDIVNLVKSTYSDKRQYAFKEAFKTLFNGKDFAVEKFGSLKALEELKVQDLFKAYLELLKDCEILISFVGHKEKKECLNAILEKFSYFKREGFLEVEKQEQYVFEGFKEKQETDVLTQAKLVIAFSKKEKEENEEDEIAIEVMNYLFGGGGVPTSLLFSNVREKQSLCYFCKSTYNGFLGVIFVESGVEGANVQKAYDAIVAQMELIKNGEFSEEEIAQVKYTLDSVYGRIFDSEERISSYVLNRFLHDEIFEPQERFEKIKKVTKEDIVKAARKFTVSLKYVLKGEQKE